MATLTISISGSAVVTGSKSYTVSDADLQSLIDWAKTAYSVPAPDTRTNAQVALAWFQGWITATKDAVKKFKADAAAATAAAGVPDISLT